MSPMANFTTTSPPPRPKPAQVMGVKVLEAAKADSVLRTATFAGGCFWGLELAFQRAAGVVSTKVRILGTSNFRAQERLKPQQAVRNQLQGELALTVKCVCVFLSYRWVLRDCFSYAQAGYAQGSAKKPTYSQVCSGKTGHTEAVQVGLIRVLAFRIGLYGARCWCRCRCRCRCRCCRADFELVAWLHDPVASCTRLATLGRLLSPRSPCLLYAVVP